VIKYFTLSGDYQASDAFEPHLKVYRDIIEKGMGGKVYGDSLKIILIQYHLEGKHWKLPEKPIKLGNYTPKGRSIGVIIGVSKNFNSWTEGEKRAFIVSTTTKAVELVKERLSRKGFTDIDFNRLLDDLEACTQEYLRLPPIDVTDYLVIARELMKNGKYQQAYALMTEQMVREPCSVSRYIFERAYCLLDLEKNRISHQSDAVGHLGAGIAFWWLNDYSEAVASWKRALPGRDKLVYGEVEALSFLYFAASIQNDRVLESEIVTLMKKKWKLKDREIWPGPIIGFLLGKIDRDTFVDFGKKPGFVSSEESVLTKIHFWMGLADYREGNMEEYQNHLKRVLSGDMFQPEYYLAKCEIKKIV
jgi:tetratricopeptide (TPR) repeat protein